MFENLTDRLSQTLRHVTGKAKLTEDNIKDTLREVRMALLEADVALPVVKDFVNSVKERAVGTEVSRSLTPGQAFVKIVQAELESLMGAANEDLALNAAPPAVVMPKGGKTAAVAGAVQPRIVTEPTKHDTDDPAMKARAQNLADRSYELIAFLVDVLGIRDVAARYDGRVTYHDSCSGLRELGDEAILAIVYWFCLRWYFMYSIKVSLEVPTHVNYEFR